MITFQLAIEGGTVNAKHSGSPRLVTTGTAEYFYELLFFSIDIIFTKVVSDPAGHHRREGIRDRPLDKLLGQVLDLNG